MNDENRETVRIMIIPVGGCRQRMWDLQYGLFKTQLLGVIKTITDGKPSGQERVRWHVCKLTEQELYQMNNLNSECKITVIPK